jgi:hypothetical protein
VYDFDWFVGRFGVWDSGFFLRIAQYGYFSPHQHFDYAFFPGYPLAIRSLGWLIGGRYVVAGLLITVISSVFAAGLLWVLAAERGGPVAGKIAVVALALNPYSIFMSAVYSEAPFLALSLGAWLAGHRGRWWWAGGLAALATAVRVNGLFLAAALLVMFLERWWADRPATRLRDSSALILPGVVALSYATWLWRMTGSWTAWHDAEVAGWHRGLAWPWAGVRAEVLRIIRAPQSAEAFAAVADTLAVLIALALVIWLVRNRRWAESVYMALSVGVLVCSTRLTSADRYTVVWFPIYLSLAEILAPPERRRVRRTLIAVALGWSIWSIWLFSSNHWVG